MQKEYIFRTLQRPIAQIRALLQPPAADNTSPQPPTTNSTEAFTTSFAGCLVPKKFSPLQGAVVVKTIHFVAT